MGKKVKIGLGVFVIIIAIGALLPSEPEPAPVAVETTDTGNDGPSACETYLATPIVAERFAALVEGGAVVRHEANKVWVNGSAWRQIDVTEKERFATIALRYANCAADPSSDLATNVDARARGDVIDNMTGQRLAYISVWSGFQIDD